MAACRRQFPPGRLDKARISGSQLCGTDTCSLEFSYPYRLQSRDGYLHLLYTWYRSRKPCR